MSAPHSPGGVNMVQASRSVVEATTAPTSWSAAVSAAKSVIVPSVAG